MDDEWNEQDVADGTDGVDIRDETEQDLPDRPVGNVFDRTLMFLPIDGDGSPVLEEQARTSQIEEEDLTELISSIAIHGVLQPIMVETIGDQYRVVAGERRLRALRYLSQHHPDNAHVKEGVPAIVAPGRYSDDNRRSAQIAENLVRADFTTSELGTALLWVRCAIVCDKLTAAGHEIPDAITSDKDAVSRWAQIETFRVRASAHNIGAPWPEVIKMLGIQVPPQRAQLLARAVSELPPGIGEEMDALKVSLHSRIQWLSLAQQDPDVAERIWEEVKDNERPDLLSAAIAAAKANPDMDPSDVVEAVSSAKDRGDSDASNDWLTSKAAAERAAADAEDDDDDDARPEAPMVEEGTAPSAGKAVGLLRKLLKEMDGGLEVPAKQREQLKVMCAQILVSFDGGDDEEQSGYEW